MQVGGAHDHGGRTRLIREIRLGRPVKLGHERLDVQRRSRKIPCHTNVESDFDPEGDFDPNEKKCPRPSGGRLIAAADFAGSTPMRPKWLIVTWRTTVAICFLALSPARAITEGDAVYTPCWDDIDSGTAVLVMYRRGLDQAYLPDCMQLTADGRIFVSRRPRDCEAMRK